MTAARQRLGARGEDRAAAWYVAQGYEVLARNWRCREGEIDLICGKDRRVVICEVKTRRSLAFGEPVEAVTRAKAARLRRLAAAYVRGHETGSARGWRQCTPAMAAGRTAQVWSLREVFLFRVAPWPQPQTV